MCEECLFLQSTQLSEADRHRDANRARVEWVGPLRRSRCWGSKGEEEIHQSEGTRDQ